MANEGLSNVSEMLSGTASMIERGGSLLEKFRGMFKWSAGASFLISEDLVKINTSVEKLHW